MSKKKSGREEMQAQLREAGEEFGRGFSLFGLAFKNVRTYAWMNMKMCFTFACLAFLLCLFTVYNAALNDYRDSLVYGSISANYFYTQDKAKRENFLESNPDVTIIHEDSYLQHSYAKIVSEIHGVGGKNDVTSAYLALGIGDELYNATKTVTMQTVGADENLFYDYDYRELKIKFGLSSPFLLGGMPQSADEIAIGEPALEAYGLQAEDVLGQTMTVYMKDTRENADPLVYQFSGKVCGVIHAEYFQLAGHKSTEATYPMLVLHKENPFMLPTATGTVTKYRLFLSEWPDELTALEWRSVFGTSYRGTTNVSGLDTLNGVQTIAANLYIIVGASLVIGLILTVFLMIDKYIKVFSRSGGILLTFGLERRKLYTLLFLQLLILCVIAVPISFVLTALGYTVINLVVSWATRINLALSWGRIIAMLGLGIGAVIVIALIFFGYAVFKIRKRTIKEFLGVEVD